MESTIFTELSLALVIAAGVSLIMRWLRQPLIIGYILAGIIVGPSLLNIITHHSAFESFSEIGITLLLFIVGLGLNVGVIRSTGRPVIIAFTVSTIGLVLVGLGLGHLFGLRVQEAMIIAMALCFSSTIIVIKSLSDKKEQNRLYAQIAVGILLLEDIFATIAILFVAAASGSGTTLGDLGLLIAKGAAVAVTLGLVSSFILPRAARFFATSQEFLFVFSLAWAFGVAAAVAWIGFSIEVGALFAGVSLASLPYAQEMSNRLKPLRDFFLVLFFISLGEQLHPSNITDALGPALVLAGALMVAKPLLVMISLGVMGYTRQTSYKVAVYLTQLSEFSIILVGMGVTSQLIRAEWLNVMIIATIITIALSTYLTQYEAKLFPLLSSVLRLFERTNATLGKDHRHGRSYQLLLFGYHKGGHEFINVFRQMKKRYLVVDYDPDVIETLEHEHIHHLYGDATDIELLDEIGLEKAELVVSTLGDFSANRIILKHTLQRNPEAIFICHAGDYDRAAQLYEHGASYVILPHFIGSQQMSQFIRRHGSNKKAFELYRRQHIVTLGNAALR